MTRYARYGSSQRHERRPENATPWEELTTAGKMKTERKDHVQKGRITKKKHSIKTNLGLESSKEITNQFDLSSKANESSNLIAIQASKSKFLKKEESSDSSEDEEFTNEVDCNSSDDNESNIDAQTSESGTIGAEDGNLVSISDNEMEKGNPTSIGENVDETNENFSTTAKILTKRQLKRAKSKMKLQRLDVKKSKLSCEAEENQNIENVSDSLQSAPTQLSNKKKHKKQKEKISENAVGTSNTDAVIADSKEQFLKKSADNNAELLNSDTCISSNDASKSDDTKTEDKPMTKKQWKKARQKKKFELLKALQESEGKEISLKNPTSKEARASSSHRDFEGKKNRFLDKCQQRRNLNGIKLLPSKVERKIYNMKRGLRGKETPDEVIKDIVRQERRHEEFKIKKTFCNKPCFNCREIGHRLSDCPLRLGDSKQATGICYKCGSTEHTSYKCQKKIDNYPFAKCFVCKEQGHISKDCPKNERGVYINGGKCNLCGNVNHLRKDCHKIKTEEGKVMTVDVISEGLSVEADVESVPIPKKKFKKVVKF